jgi:hypothetical protein
MLRFEKEFFVILEFLERISFLRAGKSPRSVSTARALLGCGALLCLASLTWWTARVAWADHLSRGSDPHSREHAVSLFPSAIFYERLAQKREESGGNSLPDFEQAAALEPENSVRRLQLGLRAELSGDFDLAERNYLQAAQLSRLYQPRYLLAQYYFRRQNADQFGAWSRAAFGIAYGDVAPLLDLCWRMQPDAESLATRAPTDRPEIASQFLHFLARQHRTEAALALALRIAGSAKSEDLRDLLDYGEQCLIQHDGSSALSLWNALCMRRLLPDRPLDAAAGASLTNGNFEHTASNLGFDWRLEKAPWIEWSRTAGGMRLTLSGNQPESCILARQYVPVLSGRRYRLRITESAGTTPANGFNWMVHDLSGRPAAIEHTPDGWAAFAATEPVVRLELLYQRPSGSTRFAGTVTLPAIRLEFAP